MHRINVVIGRFQAPELHDGYVQLIKNVAWGDHDQLIILVGVPSKMGDTHDPLDFQTRMDMLLDDPALDDLNYEVYPLYDCRDDVLWSNQIDNILKTISESRDFEAVIYGGRDNSLEHYKGVHKTHTMDIKYAGSSTEARASVKRVSSADFRRGVIYAANQRFPVSYQAVDMAVFKDEDKGRWSVLLGRKHGDSQLRLPGGFVDPKDDSLEAAAQRELQEECGVSLGVSRPEYVGSFRINDWRFRSSENAVMSAVYAFKYTHGFAEAGDDLASVQWVPVDEALTTIAELHQPVLHAAWAKFKDWMDI